MSRTLIVRVELTVKNETPDEPFKVADWVFETLIGNDEIPESVESIDGTMPSLT